MAAEIAENAQNPRLREIAYVALYGLSDPSSEILSPHYTAMCAFNLASPWMEMRDAMREARRTLPRDGLGEWYEANRDSFPPQFAR